jgi:hypothetical protein
MTGNTTGCGNVLRALSTTPIWKHLGGTRLIAVPNGNNDRDWIIRSRMPKLVMMRAWHLFRDRKVVGLSNLISCNEGLRYDPALCESKEINRQQLNQYHMILNFS